MHERLQSVGRAIKRVTGLPAYLRDIYTAYDILIDPRSRWLVFTDMVIQARRGHDLSNRMKVILQFLPETMGGQLKKDIKLALAEHKGGK